MKISRNKKQNFQRMRLLPHSKTKRLLQRSSWKKIHSPNSRPRLRLKRMSSINSRKERAFLKTVFRDLTKTCGFTSHQLKSELNRPWENELCLLLKAIR